MTSRNRPFVVAIPVYEGVDLMDIAAPREMFSWVTDQHGQKVKVHYVAETTDTPVRSRDGLQFLADKRFDDPELEVQHPNLIWVPGGSIKALSDLLNRPDATIFQYILSVGRDIDRDAAENRLVTSVCEGAVLLASTGLLDGFKVTTHWAFYPCMAAFDVRLVPPRKDANGQLEYPRFIRDRNRMTGGGISSGMDEALELIKILFGQETAESVQATTQYFPKSPVQGKPREATCCLIGGWKKNPKPCA